MKNCIFCKIIKGEMESIKIWENKKFIAILDIYPNTKGMTLIIPKKHLDSDIFEISRKEYLDLMSATKKVAKLLEKKLLVKRVAMVAEGMGVDHLHIKLYPLHGLKEKFVEMWAKNKIFFKKYEGYITTRLGPKANIGELKELAKKIKK